MPRFFAVCSLLLSALSVCAQTASAPVETLSAEAAPVESTPVEIVLPSAKPGGNATNDRIVFTFFPARPKPASTNETVPAVILLHYLGAKTTNDLRNFARDLSKRGIAGAVVTLPFHMERRPGGQSNGGAFVDRNLDVVARAFEQSASDVRTVTDWLSAREGVDESRIGIAGISLGAIITHLAMGQDARLTAGVAILGGGNLPDIYTSTLTDRNLNRRQTIAPAAMAALRAVDPLTYADSNRPRQVLMIQAARDLVVPPRDAQQLWEALGRPPIQWVDTNHPGLMLARGATMRTVSNYFEGVWSGQPFDARDLKQIYVPTIKAGFVFNLDSLVTPAIQLQFAALGTRQHRSILNANVGLSGRGLFGSVAATVNSFVDVGVARRLGGRKTKPYASVHLAF